MRAYRQTNEGQSDVQIIYSGKKVELPLILELYPAGENVLELQVTEFFDEQEKVTCVARPVNQRIKTVETETGFNQEKYELAGADSNPESRVTIYVNFDNSRELDRIVMLYFRPER